MRIKRKTAILASCALLLFTAHAQAESLFDGTVVTGGTVSITAPFGGTVQSVSVREGEAVREGDTIAQIATTRVFSPLDGTVRGLNVQPGDSAGQTVLSIAPVSKYTISASVEQAYSSVDTKYIHVGETLYIACVKDGSHQAVGRVVASNGLTYTVETSKGELYMEEKVYLYRSADYDKTSRVGQGTVARTETVDLTGSGSILALYVEEGETVERGQLLFETVEGTLDGLKATDSTICAQRAGVVAMLNVKAGGSIQKGDVIATLYLPEQFQIEIAVPEESLSQVEVGSVARISFYADSGAGTSVTGMVSSISFTPRESDTGGTSYSAYIDFDATDDVRLGMSASVTILDGDV